MKCVITFESIHQVMKAERVLQEKSVPVTLLPTPRQISSDCGMVVQIACEDLNLAKYALNEIGLPIEGIYEREEKGKVL